MSRPFRVLGLLGAALLLAAAPARGASKALVAAIGGAVPGGGVFAGPGFAGAPTAAGDGWIAFRGEVTGGGSSETIVVAHMTAPVSRAQVASLSQTAPSGDAHPKCAGKVKQFLGNPALNAKGEVAFMALLEPPANDGDTSTADVGPVAAGIFAVRGGQLAAIACSGEATAGGILDLTAVVDLFSNDESDIAERSPSIDDAGDVAFLTGYVTDKGLPAGAAILLAPQSGAASEIARMDGAFDGGKFVSLGPPALNNHGLTAFRALVTTTDPNDTDGLVDGIFAADAGGIRMLVRDGIAPMPAEQELLEFRDEISVNDAGDVAFLAGPLYDLSGDGALSESLGVLVYHAGVTTLVGYPGQPLGPDTVTGVTLGPVGGSQVAAPAVAPDGSVVFFAGLNDGNAEAIVRSDGVTLLPLVYSGGNGAEASPAGGLYAGSESAPAVDASGGVVFRARIAGGSTSEAIVYRRADGTATPIVLGEAAPGRNDGFFAGQPFSAPHVNDGGDVVFRGFVARGPTSAGVFRARGGQLAALVRAGDPSPLPGAPPFTDIVGEPSVNQAGDVAFSAQVPSISIPDPADPSHNRTIGGRGIFVAGATGLRTVVVRGDAAPGEDGAKFTGFGPNPQINDDGGVAFRGTTQAHDPVTGLSIKHDAIFLSDANGMHVLVYAHAPSPSGMPFFALRDPFLTDAPNAVFRASLGNDSELSSGLYVADAAGTSQIAVEQQPLGGDVVLTGFTGDPSVTSSGEVAFLGTRARPVDPGGPPIRSLGPAILKGGAAGLDLVVAQDMPGPAGGTFRTLGEPAINAPGHVAFRASFQPGTGGTSGFFLASADGIAPYMLRGELTPLGGRFSAFGAQAALNAHDELAFTGSVSSGSARSAIFIASPASLVTQLFLLHLSGDKGRDRLRVRLLLAPGRVSNGVRGGQEAVVVSVSDRSGVLWSVTVPGKRLAKRGKAFTIRLSRSSDLGPVLRSLRMTVARNGTVRVAASTPALDLTHRGLRPLRPPLAVSLEVGDDAGRAALDCRQARRGMRCR
jgi:hypothetical protein